MSSHELCDILKVVSNKYSPCQDICDSVERVWENCMLRGVHPAKYIKQVSYSFEGHFVQLNDLFDNDEEIVNLIMERLHVLLGLAAKQNEKQHTVDDINFYAKLLSIVYSSVIFCNNTFLFQANNTFSFTQLHVSFHSCQTNALYYSDMVQVNFRTNQLCYNYNF